MITIPGGAIAVFFGIALAFFIVEVDSASASRGETKKSLARIACKPGSNPAGIVYGSTWGRFTLDFSSDKSGQLVMGHVLVVLAEAVGYFDFDSNSDYVIDQRDLKEVSWDMNHADGADCWWNPVPIAGIYHCLGAQLTIGQVTPSVFAGPRDPIDRLTKVEGLS